MQTTRNRVRFLLGSEPIEIELTNPTITLLEYLRTSARLTGTKEGCAEGDCGACTVLIGELHHGKLRYVPANACIVFLGTVDGKQLLTVEHLAKEGGHPVQHAMAAKHGSQCGFCTPGFVMSIAGLHWAIEAKEIKQPINKVEIDDYLAGNLCRSTGYGTILDATLEACSEPLPNTWRTQISVAESFLSKWQRSKEPLFCKSNNNLFTAPISETTLHKTLTTYPGATLLAGATDIGLWVNKHGKKLNAMIYLGEVQELKHLAKNDNELEIGAGVSLSDVRKILSDISPDLDRLMRRFGSRQVCSQGTVGGNIANGSPIGDLPPAFIALGARLRIAGPTGNREIPLDNFFIDYGKQDLATGEFVKAILIPLNQNLHFRCWKIAKRFDQDISAVLGAFAAKIDNGVIRNVRICFGGMAGIPKRAIECEDALTGKLPDSQTYNEARQALVTDFDPITDMRATKRYRQRIAGALLEKFLFSLAASPLPDIYDEKTL